MTLTCIHGKFNTSTRRNKVSVDGNSVYCTIDNFREYANYKQFFAFKYDTNTTITENVTDKNVTTNTSVSNAEIKNTVGQIYKLSANTKLYTSSSMKIAYNYKKNTKVQVLENVTSDIDKVKVLKTNLVRYMYNDNDTNTKNIAISTNTTTNNVLKNTYTLKSNTKLYKNSALRNGYNYKKGTKLKLLSKTNNIAKVQVVKTNIIRYVNMKYLK